MARKSPHVLKSHQDRHAKSWAALGIDTSMTSVAVAGISYDAVLDKRQSVAVAQTRWMPDDDYFKRLGEAARSEGIVMDVLTALWMVKFERVFIAFEEPWYYGAVKTGKSQWLKQQAEIAGAVKGSLVRYGFTNLYEINNQQWKAVLRKEGCDLASNKKDPRMKWKVKEWAIEAYGLPDFPDLVANREGAKIPRPAEGYGARAKGVQPDDIYDATAVMAWMQDQIDRGAV
jgi:hypothetical protein